MADGGVLNSRSEVTRSLHSLTVFYPSSSQHLNRTLLKPTTVTVRSVQALKKAIGCCRSWNKKSLFKILFPVKHYDIHLCVFIPVIRWTVSCWRTGGELRPSLFEISGRVWVFCRSLLGPFGLLKLLRSWGLLWVLCRYCLAISFCRCWTSWRQSYHRWAAVLLSVNQLRCINISDLKGIKKRHALPFSMCCFA